MWRLRKKLNEGKLSFIFVIFNICYFVYNIRNYVFGTFKLCIIEINDCNVTRDREGGVGNNEG